jgi:hypothetical protein
MPAAAFRKNADQPIALIGFPEAIRSTSMSGRSRLGTLKVHKPKRL